MVSGEKNSFLLIVLTGHYIFDLIGLKMIYTAGLVEITICKTTIIFLFLLLFSFDLMLSEWPMTFGPVLSKMRLSPEARLKMC